MKDKGNESVKVREKARLLAQAQGAEGKDLHGHTRWARDKTKRIRELQQQGYRAAKPEDVGENHDGYLHGEDNTIHNGDLVLMIGPRDGVEKREAERVQYLRDVERSANEHMDREGEFETDRSRHGQERGGKFYSTP